IGDGSEPGVGDAGYVGGRHVKLVRPFHSMHRQGWPLDDRHPAKHIPAVLCAELRFGWNDEVPHMTAVVHGLQTIDQRATLERHPANVGFDLRMGLEALHRYREGQADDIAAAPLSLELGIAVYWLRKRERFAVHLQPWIAAPTRQAHVQGDLGFP